MAAFAFVFDVAEFVVLSYDGKIMMLMIVLSFVVVVVFFVIMVYVLLIITIPCSIPFTIVSIDFFSYGASLDDFDVN